MSAEYSLVSGVPSAPAWVSYFHLAPAQTQQETLAQSVQHYPSRGGVGGAAWVFGRNFFFFSVFLGLHPCPVEVPRLGV